MQSVCLAKSQGISNFILIGNEANTKKILQNINQNLNFDIINETKEEEACKIAVSLAKDGKATAIMKGICETSTIMRSVLNKDYGIIKSKNLSHLAAFEVKENVYHKLIFLTDAAINISPNISDKKEIIRNSVSFLHKLGIPSPKVALLAAKEKVDKKMPITLEYEQIVKEHLLNNYKDCEIYGPLALDNAINKNAANIKGITNSVAGDADILLCPNIEAGNILYKSLAFLAEAKTCGIVLGAQVPLVLTSRADTAQTKLLSITMSTIM